MKQSQQLLLTATHIIRQVLVHMRCIAHKQAGISLSLSLSPYILALVCVSLIQRRADMNTNTRTTHACMYVCIATYVFYFRRINASTTHNDARRNKRDRDVSLNCAYLSLSPILISGMMLFTQISAMCAPEGGARLWPLSRLWRMRATHTHARTRTANIIACAPTLAASSGQSRIKSRAAYK